MIGLSELEGIVARAQPRSATKPYTTHSMENCAFTPKFNLFGGENLQMLCVDEMVALHDWSEVGLRLVGCDAREGRVTVRARTVTTVCCHLKPSRDDRRKPPRPLAAF